MHLGMSLWGSAGYPLSKATLTASTRAMGAMGAMGAEPIFFFPCEVSEHRDMSAAVRRIGIIGHGAIGSHVARAICGIQMHVHGHGLDMP